MDRIKNRKNRQREAADLDVTPFMNLMIVLVPVLLLSMVFTHTTVIDLNFPAGESAADAIDPENVHLEVVVRNDTLVVADGCAAKSDDAHNATLCSFYNSFGDVQTTDEIVVLLKDAVRAPIKSGTG